jgi:hypothetical protein
MKSLFISVKMCSMVGITLAFILLAPAASEADNQPPEINLSFSSRQTNEDTPLHLPSITVSDPDAGGNAIQVRLSCIAGQLMLAATTGLTFTQGGGGGGAVIEATGTLADWNNAMADLVYTPSTNYNGPDVFSIHADDLGWTGSGGPMTDDAQAAITVNAINDGPILTNVPAGATAIAEKPLILSPLAVATDPDILSNRGKCTLSVLHGRLTLGTTAGLIFTIGDGLNDATMQFLGTFAAFNAAMAQVTYVSAAGYIGNDTVTITVSDEGYSGAGGAKNATSSVPVTVTSPTAAAPATWGGIKELF